MTYKKIACAEYGVYFLGDDKKVYTYDQLMKLNAFPVDNVAEFGTGLQNVSMITESGQVYNAVRSGANGAGAGTVKTISITNGLKTSGFHTMGGIDTYAVIRKNGLLSCYDENGVVVDMQMPDASTKFIKVVASYMLMLLDDQGGVWQYDWRGPGANTVRPTADLVSVAPVKIILPGKATDIASSKSMFNVAIVNGDPYVWFEYFGSGRVGYDYSQQLTAINARAKWGITVKIKQIIANDNTLHFIDENDELWGMGENAQGEVGNGQEHPTVKSTGGWDMTVSLAVLKPVNISNGRKYGQLSTGNFMVYYTYAQELNGQWSSCGGRPKGGVLGNGIWKTDDNNVNLMDVPTFRRVPIPAQGTKVDETFLKDPSKYPVAEPDVIIPPKIVAQLFSDGTWQYLK